MRNNSFDVLTEQYSSSYLFPTLVLLLEAEQEIYSRHKLGLNHLQTLDLKFLIKSMYMKIKSELY